MRGSYGTRGEALEDDNDARGTERTRDGGDVANDELEGKRWGIEIALSRLRTPEGGIGMGIGAALFGLDAMAALHKERSQTSHTLITRLLLLSWPSE